MFRRTLSRHVNPLLLQRTTIAPRNLLRNARGFASSAPEQGIDKMTMFGFLGALAGFGASYVSPGLFSQPPKDLKQVVEEIKADHAVATATVTAQEEVTNEEEANTTTTTITEDDVVKKQDDEGVVKHPSNAIADVIFVLGGPGAGKGTNCARLVEDYGFVHLSAGDLLRAERKSGSENAKLINDYIVNGRIVPVEITVSLIKTAMESHVNQHQQTKFLIDGFPRNEDNLHGWNTVMGDYADVKFVLFLTAPEDVMQERLLERGKSSGRADDNVASIAKRFIQYETESRPIIDKFDAKGRVRAVHSHLSKEEVYAQVQAVMAQAGYEKQN